MARTQRCASRLSGFIDRNADAMLLVPFCFGQVLVQKNDGGFELRHRDDRLHHQLQTFRGARAAIHIARYDDEGRYRPLKTAPNLRHGWRLELDAAEELKRALDNFYPGRLAVLAACQTGQLHTTPLRETLDRQSGMYRIAAKISDTQIDRVVADFCRSDSGCLRTILWKRDQSGAPATTKLPAQKFDPEWDQVQASAQGQGCRFATTTAAKASLTAIPLLCQEGCNLLVAACRNAVKAE